MGSIADLREELMQKHGTKNNQYSDFPVGTSVQVITPCQDFNFFNDERGVVIENKATYLGIIVRFDKKYNRPDFNFEPKDLIVLSPEEKIKLKTPREELEDKVLDAIEGHYLSLAEGLSYTPKEMARKSVTFKNLMKIIDNQDKKN